MTSPLSLGIELACSNCDKPHQKTLGWVEVHKNLVCTCGTISDIEIIQLKMEFDRLQSQSNEPASHTHEVVIC